MIQAGIIGATGYAGVELVRLLLRHPQVELAAVSSVSFEGQPLAEVYPNLNEITPLVCEAADEVIRKSDVVVCRAAARAVAGHRRGVCRARQKVYRSGRGFPVGRSTGIHHLVRVRGEVSRAARTGGLRLVRAVPRRYSQNLHHR